jgi:hypothetical protein
MSVKKPAGDFRNDYELFSIGGNPLNLQVQANFNVRLKGKEKKDKLESIATFLKERHAPNHRAALILFYLPGMEVGAGAWATVKITTSVDARILGMTSEQEDKLVSGAQDDGGKVVGAWIDERPHVGSLVVLLEQEGKLSLEYRHGVSGVSRREVRKALNADGRLLESMNKEEIANVTYWIMNPDGTLTSGDIDGVICNMKPVEIGSVQQQGSQ